jgi:hypothetical protein
MALEQLAYQPLEVFCWHYMDWCDQRIGKRPLYVALARYIHRRIEAMRLVAATRFGSLDFHICAYSGGGIGQPLSLLLKMNKLVAELALYDIAGTPGVAADLSHCNTPVTVTAHTGPGELDACLRGCDLVIIPAGIPRKPGMTRDDLFNTNAGAHLPGFEMLSLSY